MTATDSSVHSLPAERAIRSLVEQADLYFAALSGPGPAEVRAGLARWRSAAFVPGTATASAVIDTWLPVALQQLAPTHAPLAAAIDAAQRHLCWFVFDGYPTDAAGADFLAKHAYAPIIGETAAIPAVDWEMGLFLIAPHVLYRDHRHQASELYAPLTGPHGWRFGAQRPLRILPAHQPVWNEPFAPHLTKVGPTPFLGLYAWTRDINAGAEIVPATDWSALETLRLEP